MRSMGRRQLYLLTIVLVFLFVAFSGLVTQKSAEGNAGYVGVDTCKGCHDGYFESYAKSIHAKKAIPGSPANGSACESCHGSGTAHVEKGGGKGTGIIAFNRKADPKKKSAQCLSCHEESNHLASWDMSKHKSAGVSCDNCHSAHSGGDKGLKTAQTELCFGCHRDIKAQVSKQSHHPVKEGKISCSSCHDPHGSFGPSMVKADSVNELCYKCHAEKRGPYMFEHPPVEENCLSCHTVHGSNHTKLLVRKGPQLCQSCHDWTRHPGGVYSKFYSFEPPTGTLLATNMLVGRNCLNCHTNVHGSNGPSTHGLRFIR